MAKQNDEEQQEATVKPKRSGKLKLVVLLVLLVFIGGGGYAAWLFYFQGKLGAATEAKPLPKANYSMDTLLVNLADPGGKRYLKTTMNLVLSNALTATEFNERSAELRDTVLLLYSSKKYDDIATYAGKTTLKQETMTQLNRKLTQGQVEDVHFTEFLVQ